MGDYYKNGQMWNLDSTHADGASGQAKLDQMTGGDPSKIA
jgi:hypothetical protein